MAWLLSFGLASFFLNGLLTFENRWPGFGVQPMRGQPHTDAVVHDPLHALGTSAGERVGVVRQGGAEDAHEARQGRRGA